MAIADPKPAPTRQSKRRARAVALAQNACSMLEELGVSARIIGSLAKDRFAPSSDIDFLILDCPRYLKYAIEGRIEDSLEGFAFDVVYLDDVPPHKTERLLREAVVAGDLR